MENNINLIFAGSCRQVLAAIEPVDPQDVSPGHSPPLADLNTGVWDGGDGVPSVDGEGPSAVVHDGGVVVGGVQVVGVLPVEVVGIASIDVPKVDPDVAVPVTPGLLVVEAQSVVQLVLHDAEVHASRSLEREDLPAPCPAQRGVASTSALNADVVVLVPAGHEADAGAPVEGPHGAHDPGLLGGGVGSAHCVGNGHQAVGGLFPQAAVPVTLHGVSGGREKQVSLQQNLIGAVVGDQNPGADVHVLMVFWEDIIYTFFPHQRLSLGEVSLQQQLTGVVVRDQNLCAEIRVLGVL